MCVSAGGSCITAPEYKARDQGWDAAGTGLCSCVEGICNVTEKYTGNNKEIFLKRTFNLFVTKEVIGKGQSLSYNTERWKGLGWAGMQSFPLTGNGTI